MEPTTQVYHDKICEEVPGYNPQENWPHTHQEVMSLLGQADDHFVVAKDLAYQTSFSIKELKWLAEKYHILFLIRHPKKTILSNLYPYYQEGTVDSFKESSLGYKELGTLFARFQEETGITPWVIEAENYLKDPKQQLSKYFNKFGIKWKDSYLKLKPKTKEENKLILLTWFGLIGIKMLIPVQVSFLIKASVINPHHMLNSWKKKKNRLQNFLRVLYLLIHL